VRPWLRRRRRFEGDRYPSDREAAEAGADGLESAVNWMQHVLGRDFEGGEVSRCVIVAEVQTPAGPATVYTTHSVDAAPVDVRGLMTEGLRALDELRAREIRRRDIEEFVNAALPQLLQALDEPLTDSAKPPVSRTVNYD
jgi:hypothetical protein